MGAADNGARSHQIAKIAPVAREFSRLLDDRVGCMLGECSLVADRGAEVSSVKPGCVKSETVR